MVACFRHRRRRAAVHRAAARQGPARCGSRCAAAGAGRSPTSATSPSSTPPRRRARSWVPDESLFAASPPPPPSSPRRPVPDHVHERDRRRAQGGPARAALPRRAAPPGRALARARAGRARLVHGRQRLVEVGAQRVHRALAAAARRRCCTTRASIPPSAWTLLERERVDVLCMAPTEYRVIAKRATIRGAAGPAAAWWPPARRSTPRCCGAWHEATGLEIRDGYGQTETGQLTGIPVGRAGAAGLDGPAAAGHGAGGRRRRARARPGHGAHLLPRLPRRGRRPAGRGTPATGSPATRTASCTSRAAPTT